ncbi:MAG: regulatory protein GemA [Deltaproteobacteria bacterium]|jgi:phage gp16-like protein|nr:regulatory protein GemA [Deltaproteobacteria bacterium]
MSLDRGILAKIHIAKKELGFDDDSYRDILQTRYKKDSAAKLSRFEAEDLITHFKGQGFKVKRKTAGQGVKTEGKGKPFAFKSSPTYEKPMARKVVAIWINMALAGVVKNSSDAALQSYVKRMTDMDNLAWCDDGQLWMLIEALKKWAKRKGVELDD